jgi:hypothetical protein
MYYKSRSVPKDSPSFCWLCFSLSVLYILSINQDISFWVSMNSWITLFSFVDERWRLVLNILSVIIFEVNTKQWLNSNTCHSFVSCINLFWSFWVGHQSLNALQMGVVCNIVCLVKKSVFIWRHDYLCFIAITKLWHSCEDCPICLPACYWIHLNYEVHVRIVQYIFFHVVRFIWMFPICFLPMSIT